MLFSATLSYKVRELAFEDMNDPEYVEIEPEQKTGQQIKEELFYPSNQDKIPLLLTLLEEEWPERCIIFANTKHQCEAIWGYLAADGHRVGLLTGDVAQKKRLSLLKQFTDGDLDILVATDVAARGLHIPAVTHVFNYDLPDDCEDYVHRIGRTGRAGNSGTAVTFVDWDDVPRWRIIAKALGLPIEEPVETYHTSEHLFSDLSIPEKVTGRLPRHKRTLEGLDAEEIEDLGETGRRGRKQSGRQGGRGGRDGNSQRSRGSRDTKRGERSRSRRSADDEAKPRRKRTRKRTRGGRPVDGSAGEQA